MNEFWVEFTDGTQCYMCGRSFDNVRRDILEELAIWDIEAAYVYDTEDKATRKCIGFVE